MSVLINAQVNAAVYAVNNSEVNTLTKTMSKKKFQIRRSLRYLMKSTHSDQKVYSTDNSTGRNALRAFNYNVRSGRL